MIIYAITNTINGKKYVGQTTQALEKRLRGHRWASSGKGGKNMPIAIAIQKYGWENFTVEILCECESYGDLNIKEVFYVNLLNTMVPNGYNLKAGGGGKGKNSVEINEKIGKSNKGKIVSEETRKKQSISHKGKKQSEVAKEKLRKHFTGIPPHPNTIKAIIEKSSKTYTFIQPDGTCIKIHNLKKFCRENNIGYTKMVSVASGKKPSHKGWEIAKF